MKKILYVLVFVLILSILPACSNKTKDKESLSIITSSQAMFDFTKKIASDAIEVQLLIPQGQDAHDWEPSSKDMILLEQADLLIINGAGAEPWLDKILSALDDPPKVLITSQDIALLSLDEHSEYDPHVWLNPQNAKRQMQSILKKLCELDPKNEQKYKDNFQKNEKKIDRLDDEFKQAISQFSTNKIIVSHSAYAYLCDAYGLEQVPLEGLQGEGDPSPAQMAKLIDYIKENKIPAVFHEPNSFNKALERIAEEANCVIAIIDPYEMNVSNDNQSDYFTVMENNLKSLKNNLK